MKTKKRKVEKNNVAAKHYQAPGKVNKGLKKIALRLERSRNEKK
jgi:hypothetical protein